VQKKTTPPRPAALIPPHLAPPAALPTGRHPRSFALRGTATHQNAICPSARAARTTSSRWEVPTRFRFMGYSRASECDLPIGTRGTNHQLQVVLVCLQWSPPAITPRRNGSLAHEMKKELAVALLIRTEWYNLAPRRRWGVSGNNTHIAEMYGGLGTPSRVLSGVAVPIAYLDSDPDASDVFESAHPWAATHTCTAREALTSAGDASSFVAVAEHARIAFMGVPCRNLIPMNSHRDEQGDDARQC
jgi:hypothetical protein